jgi:thiol-disulfide isomerase/thioredoxin
MNKLFTLGLFVLTLLAACSKSDKNTLEGSVENQTVQISGQITNPNGKEVTVSFQPLHFSLQAATHNAALDSNGQFSLKLPAEEAGYVTLQHGKERTTLYLHPGDQLKVNLDTEKFDESLKYEGEGAQINNYLVQRYLLDEEMMQLGPEGAFALETQAFMDQNDDWHQKNLKLLDSMVNEEKYADFVATEKAELKAQWAFNLRNYPGYYSRFTQKEPVEVKGYETYAEQIDFHNEANLNAPTMRAFIGWWTEKEAAQLIPEEVKETARDSYENWQEYSRMRLKAVFNLAQTKYSGKIREYLSAATLLQHLSFNGLEGFDPLKQAYDSVYSQSEYALYVKDIQDRLLAIQTGQPAPDFTYVSNEGTEVSLSDFKGKVVYVDVWATWCGPCRREFPYAAELKKAYKDAEDVVFMYVSVDDDKESWETYLKENPDFEGVHLWAKGWSDIARDYQISGIPRYLLIGKDGKIISADAPRPSDKETIQSLIEEHRTKKEQV